MDDLTFDARETIKIWVKHIRELTDDKTDIDEKVLETIMNKAKIKTVREIRRINREFRDTHSRL